MTEFKPIYLAGGGVVHLPATPSFNWSTIFADLSVPVVFTDNLRYAATLAARGVAVIGVCGVSRAALERWLAEGGANVIVRQGALH